MRILSATRGGGWLFPIWSLWSLSPPPAPIQLSQGLDAIRTGIPVLDRKRLFCLKSQSKRIDATLGGETHNLNSSTHWHLWSFRAGFRKLNLMLILNATRTMWDVFYTCYKVQFNFHNSSVDADYCRWQLSIRSVKNSLRCTQTKTSIPRGFKNM